MRAAALALLFAACVLGQPANIPTSGHEANSLCNFENHHSHLVIPLTTTEEACGAEGAKFLFSHGATFFCPHTFDVKLLGTFSNNTQQQVLCSNFFDAYDEYSPTAEVPVSLKFVLRPTLPVNGLPATGAELTTQWTSPVLYYVYNFGNDSSAGPDNGWNTTTLLNEDITVNFQRALYFREFDLAAVKPSSLSYLLYRVPTSDGVERYFLTHYITSAPDFDQIIFLTSVSSPVPIRRRWPVRVEVPNVPNEYDHRLLGGDNVAVTMYVNDPQTGLPVSYTVQLETGIEIYSGIDDGFADFGYNCPFPPPYPQARGLCYP